MKMRFFFGVVFLLLLASDAIANVPQMINYQGELTDGMGNPLDTTVSIVFTIYDDSTGGVPLWTETHSAVTTNGGLFKVLLGSMVPIDDSVFAGDQRWFEITAGGETISPRTRLTSVPYSHRVATVDSASGGAISGNLLVLGSTSKEPTAPSRHDDEPPRISSQFIGAGYPDGFPFIHDPEEGHIHVYNSDGVKVMDFDGEAGKATIGPGNTNTGLFGFVAGWGNTVSGDSGTVSGGRRNIVSGSSSTIGGGISNEAIGIDATIGGGKWNEAIGDAATISGGVGCMVEAMSGTIGGGGSNSILVDGVAATIAGGHYNKASGDRSTIGGGGFNKTRGDFSVVAGGGISTFPPVDSNFAHGDWSAIGGGGGNGAVGHYSTIGGGGFNKARGGFSVVAGGGIGTEPYTDSNFAHGDWSTIGGGGGNGAVGDYGTVAGGFHNLAGADSSVIPGGAHNNIEQFGKASAICGGNRNTIRAPNCVITGGDQNEIDEDCHHTMIFGSGVCERRSYHVAFFKGDVPGVLNINRDHNDDPFVPGPIVVGTNGNNGNGAHLTGGGMWIDVCSRESKEKFQPLDGRELLERVSSMEVKSWQYKGSDERHIGPVAEDFVAAFDVGIEREDGTRYDKYLAAMDVAGVALAGVKELIAENQELRELIRVLEERIAKLETK